MCDPKTIWKLPGKSLFFSGAGIAEGRRQNPGKIPRERLSPACGTRWAKGKLQPRLTREGINRNPTKSTPALPVWVKESSAPTPKSLTTLGVSPGNPRDPCPALHQLPAKIPARSPGLCLPAPPSFPIQQGPTAPKTSSAPPTLSQTFISTPRLQLCWERLSCSSGAAQSHPWRVEEPPGR